MSKVTSNACSDHVIGGPLGARQIPAGSAPFPFKVATAAPKMAAPCRSIQIYTSDQSRVILHRPGSRHCHLAIGYCTIRQRVFDCKYLSCNICFNVLNYVFTLFSFNLYCLVNIQQPCHNSSHCD